MAETVQAVANAPARSFLDKARRFVLILPGLGAQAMLFGIFAADLPHIAAHFGGGAQGEFTASMALTSGALGLLLGGWLSGWLLERMGFRAFFAFSLVLMALTASSAAFINNAPLLIASRVAAGVATSFLTTTCIALIPLLYEEKDRAGIIGFQIAFGGAASALVFVVAGALIDAGDWRTPIYLFLPVFLLALVLAPLLPKRGNSAANAAPVAKSDWPAVAAHWRFFLVAAALPILVFIGSVQLPLLVQMNGPMSSLQASTMLGLCSLLLSMSAFFYGPLAHRLGPVRLLQTGLGLVAAGLVILGALPGIAPSVAGIALLGLGLGPIVPYLNDAAVKRSARGGALVIGVFVTVASLGSFINPIVFSPLIAASGLRGAFLIVATLVAVAAAVSLAAGAGRRTVTAAA